MARRFRTQINPATFLDPDQDAVAQVLPEALAPVAFAVVSSRTMLELTDDWDGEGSPGYQQSTWLRAVAFIVDNALAYLEEHGVPVPAPKVRKGPAGSIDLHWREPERELLVNIPAHAATAADYYGDDRSGGHIVKGTLDP